MKWSIFPVTFLFLLSFCAVSAQPSNRKIVNNSIEWFAITSNLQISKKLSILVEGQFRYAQDLDPLQYQARTALEIKFKDFAIVPLGYVYTWNFKYGKQPSTFENNEHRSWQQVTYKHFIGRIRFDHRLRLEQRFIQVHTLTDEGTIMYEGYDNRQNRIRYRFMSQIPLNEVTIKPKTYFLSFYDEAFLSWGKKIKFHEPDQNRIFAGLGYQFNKNLTTQGGFFYQMLIKSNGAQQENNVGFQVQITYNMNLVRE